jgi:hypothetical protein
VPRARAKPFFEPVDEIGRVLIGCWDGDEGWGRTALGRQRERQAEMPVSWAETSPSPGRTSYDKLPAVLIASDFDRLAERQCASTYPPRGTRPPLPPDRDVRMLPLGYFNGIDSEHVPTHSWQSQPQSRLPKSSSSALPIRIQLISSGGW